MQKSLWIFPAFILGLCMLWSTDVIGQEEISDKNKAEMSAKEIQNEERFDVAKAIMEEILDNHEFVLAEIKGRTVSIPLPVGGSASPVARP